MSLSRVVQADLADSAVSIGAASVERARQEEAEAILRRHFPQVATVTDANGSQSIPIGEVLAFHAAIESARKSARETGYKEGLAAGLAKGGEEARSVVRQFEAAIADAVSQREQLLRSSQKQILDIILKISRKVTFDAVTLDPETTVNLIRGVIETLTDQRAIRIKVHPDHLAIVELHRSRLLGDSTAIKELSFEADPRVRFGGCFIETPTGDIDARLESQFEILDEALAN